MSDSLHLVRMGLDRRELHRRVFGFRSPRAVDEGCLLHDGLAKLFAVSPEERVRVRDHLGAYATDEALAESPDALFLLAYSPHADDALAARMGPRRGELLRHFASKAVPPIAAGTRLQFRVRAHPTVRTRLPVDGREPQTDAAGRPRAREVDAWLLRQSEGGDEWAGREAAYAGWLARELARGGAADLVRARVSRFALAQVYRRDGGGTRRRLTLPDATLEGELAVADADAFRALLLRGVGRHRAFGSGMLLVAPARG